MWRFSRVAIKAIRVRGESYRALLVCVAFSEWALDGGRLCRTQSSSGVIQRKVIKYFSRATASDCTCGELWAARGSSWSALIISLLPSFQEAKQLQVDWGSLSNDDFNLIYDALKNKILSTVKILTLKNELSNLLQQLSNYPRSWTTSSFCRRFVRWGDRQTYRSKLSDASRCFLPAGGTPFWAQWHRWRSPGWLDYRKLERFHARLAASNYIVSFPELSSTSMLEWNYPKKIVSSWKMTKNIFTEVSK